MINNKKILFHMCCAPCSYKTSEILVNEGYTVTGFFYNPNIHPDFEFRRRKENVKKLALFKGIDIIYSDIYDIKTWETYNKSSEKRCKMCYTLRLTETAKKARELGYTGFTSSLLISPYQNHEQIINISKALEEKYNIPFIYKDFRKVFRESYNEARKKGIYTQKYCGCIISLNKSPFKEKINSSFM